MKNKVSDGLTIKQTATAEVKSGAVAVIGGHTGVAVNPAASGEEVILDIRRGVYEIPVAVAANAAQGANVYLASGKTYGAASGDFTLTSGSGVTKIGTLYEGAASGATSVKVLVN